MTEPTPTVEPIAPTVPDPAMPDHPAPAAAGRVACTGRFVQYMLTADDAEEINRRRTSAGSIKERMDPKASRVRPVGNEGPVVGQTWPEGAQAPIGNRAVGGQVYAALIVQDWHDGQGGTALNLQVFLDGNDVLWKTSVLQGPGPGTWVWPTIR
jgi:hypothetical protein